MSPAPQPKPKKAKTREAKGDTQSPNKQTEYRILYSSADDVLRFTVASRPVFAYGRPAALKLGAALDEVRPVVESEAGAVIDAVPARSWAPQPVKLIPRDPEIVVG